MIDLLKVSGEIEKIDRLKTPQLCFQFILKVFCPLRLKTFQDQLLVFFSGQIVDSDSDQTNRIVLNVVKQSNRFSVYVIA